jgi:cell division protein FtsB
MKLFFNIIKNKYLITIVALAVWVAYFDKNDLSAQIELQNKVTKLENERDFYKSEIENNNKMIKLLQTDSISLDKFARETYLMKKDNEEVFVFVSK